MAEIEKEVERRDACLKDFNAKLLAASQAKQGSRVVEVSKSMHLEKKAIDGLLEELEKLTVEYDGLKAGFDARLRALDAEDA